MNEEHEPQVDELEFLLSLAFAKLEYDLKQVNDETFMLEDEEWIEPLRNHLLKQKTFAGILEMPDINAVVAIFKGPFVKEFKSILAELVSRAVNSEKIS